MNKSSKMGSLKHPVISYSLVVLQFVIIGWLAFMLFKSWFAEALVVQILAVVLGLWAIKTMHFGHFNIIPDPLPDSVLVNSGPYKYIRHPMYSSILLFFLPILFTEQRVETVLGYFLLVTVLWLKLNYEESLLVEALPPYKRYQQHTHRLIPFVL